MRRTNKKGFTIVELVIVIAVIAILAAVLIPTFASLVKKANQSADIQAVKQMNTQLAIAEADNKIESIGAAVSALAEVKINLDNYTPLTTGKQFYWVKSENRVIYVDLEKNEILYPEEYKNLEHKAGDWLSLNGEIETKAYTITTTGEGDEATKAVEIEEAGQLAKLIDDYNNGKNDAKSVTKITLAEDIDLAGATVKFQMNNVDDASKGTTGGSASIEIDGGGKTVYGLRDDTQSLFGSNESANKGYGYGLFGSIGTNEKVTIKNVTFDGIHVEDTANEDTGTLGLIAGYIYGTLELEDVTFKNCSVTGSQKIGGIVGQLHGTLNMKNVKFVNTTVSGSCEVAKIAGIAYGKLTVDADCDMSGITTVALCDTFTSSAFSVKCGDKDVTMKGDSANTFKYKPSSKYGDNYIGVYNVTTNDWAWYRMSTEVNQWNGVGAATYEGKTCFLNGTSFSASTNFADGKPVSDASSETGN